MNKKITISIIGLALVALGAWWFMGMQKPPVDSIGEGRLVRCGGNTRNAPACAPGYHCAPESGSELPVGDVGGVCVRD